jgi:hypothetical protein
MLFLRLETALVADFVRLVGGRFEIRTQITSVQKAMTDRKNDNDNWKPYRRHARDCAYVTMDGPAACSCGYYSAKGITALGAGIGDFEQWIIDEQRKEKEKKKKPKPATRRSLGEG